VATSQGCYKTSTHANDSLAEGREERVKRQVGENGQDLEKKHHGQSGTLLGSKHLTAGQNGEAGTQRGRNHGGIGIGEKTFKH